MSCDHVCPSPTPPSLPSYVPALLAAQCDAGRACPAQLDGSEGHTVQEVCHTQLLPQWAAWWESKCTHQLLLRRPRERVCAVHLTVRCRYHGVGEG